ncbi:Hypothetical predicted protein [Marmota monax]|uniref:Uncharacterized protein n=1 Tax=Marmota monax TaxID=9995 RepID=A0A5E4D409_MARMO|nr:Hypothetical predicted protein [Marmota monax]
MASDKQMSYDESPSTSSGSSDADQQDPAAPEPEDQEERTFCHPAEEEHQTL